MEDTVNIHWSMGAGRPGLDSDPMNPLSRSLARLINTGKPFSRLSLCFLSEEGGLFRWFGVFVQGKRTMFFPGFASVFDGIKSQIGPRPNAERAFEFDHLSLEPDLKTWHVTARGSTDHLGSPRTLSLGNGRFLWFGVSFSFLDTFHPVMDKTLVVFPVPDSDSKRRRQVVVDARDHAKFPVLSLPDGPLIPRPRTFLHASVIAGPAGFEDYLGQDHAFPIGSPFLRSPFPSPLINLPTRIHRLELSSATDLQITLTRLPGRLNVPVAFTGQQESTAAAQTDV